MSNTKNLKIDSRFAEVIQAIDGALIVSTQASKGEPLCQKEHILALALSAINGGARALRLEGTENIRFVRDFVDKAFTGFLPIIGLTKAEVPDQEKLSSVYITPSFADAQALAGSGADIIALDATQRRRQDEYSLAQTIEMIHEQLGKPVWADCSTFGDALQAFEAGADIVSTTLYGYTQETSLPKDSAPSFALLGDLVEHVNVPVILEGRVWQPEELTKAFETGAYAVVVGSAITRPQLITERFVKAIPNRRVRRATFSLLV